MVLVGLIIGCIYIRVTEYWNFPDGDWTPALVVDLIWRGLLISILPATITAVGITVVDYLWDR